MKFERTKVSGFENALFGMRNPMNSWDRSDSCYGISNLDGLKDYEVAKSYLKKMEIPEDTAEYDEKQDTIAAWLRNEGLLRKSEDYEYLEYAFIGANDMDLAMRLCAVGSEHRKFLRQIQVSVDITAPLYLWKELDTYKVGTTANSTSTMHKLASTPITLDCFETDDYEPSLTVGDRVSVNDIIGRDENFQGIYIGFLETLRQKYNETKDKRYLKELIRWLPESWLQTRMITMNYENVRNICAQRQGHRLTEWASFIAWARKLPYADALIFDEDIKAFLKNIV